jgi:hypothetical protein
MRLAKTHHSRCRDFLLRQAVRSSYRQESTGQPTREFSYPLPALPRLATPGLQRNHLAQESHKLPGGMVGRGLTQDLAAFGVERGIERERAMPIVLEAVALGPPGAKRQHRVEAIEGLNRGLLIDTEHRSVLRRIDVEPDHIGGLALEVPKNIIFERPSNGNSAIFC